MRLLLSLAGLSLAFIALGQATANQSAGDSKKTSAQSQQSALDDLYQKQVDAKQWADAHRTVDRMTGCESCRLLWHLRTYSEAGDAAGYSVTAKALLVGKFKDDPDVLNEIAWDIVNPDGTMKSRDLNLAREAAEKAVALSKRRDAGMLDTLGWTYHWLGENAKAIGLEREALARAVPSEKDIYRAILKDGFARVRPEIQMPSSPGSS